MITIPETMSSGEFTELVARCRRADGITPIGGQLSASAPLLAATCDGAVVGVATLPPGDPTELCVDPAFRRRGIGTSLLRRALETQPGMWAHGNLPPAQALAARFGLHPRRTLLQLRCPLPGSIALSRELPPGVVIAPFRPGIDDDAFLAANARAFAWHPEQGRLDRQQLTGLLAQPWADPDGFLLAWRDGATGRELVGFHWTKIHPVDPTPLGSATAGPIGEVYVIAVDPTPPSAHRARGLAVPLTLAGLDLLAARGQQTAMLYVEADNAAALALYQRLGFTEYLRDVVYQLQTD